MELMDIKKRLQKLAKHLRTLEGGPAVDLCSMNNRQMQKRTATLTAYGCNEQARQNIARIQADPQYQAFIKECGIISSEPEDRKDSCARQNLQLRMYY